MHYERWRKVVAAGLFQGDIAISEKHAESIQKNGMVIAWNVFGPVFSRLHLLAGNMLYLGVAHYGY